METVDLYRRLYFRIMLKRFVLYRCMCVLIHREYTKMCVTKKVCVILYTVNSNDLFTIQETLDPKLECTSNIA